MHNRMSTVRCNPKQHRAQGGEQAPRHGNGRGAFGSRSALPIVFGSSLVAVAALTWLVGTGTAAQAAEQSSRWLRQVIAQVEPKLVKIYGAGGFRGLEAYQSGIFISPAGHVLTTWSYVLDADPITVVTHDGQHLEGRLLGTDPRLEIAVLATDRPCTHYFDLSKAMELTAGTRVLAFSNLFGIAADREPVSVQHGVVAAVARLDARRGVFPTSYSGPVYVLDVVTGNPGAQGGALVDYRGRIAGMLGKELRSSRSHIWLNYALPIGQLRGAVARIVSGKPRKEPEQPGPVVADPVTVEELGIVLVPELVPRTPPYIDQVLPGSAAEQAGLLADDLLVMIAGELTPTCHQVRRRLGELDRKEPIAVTVFRGEQMIQTVLQLQSR